MKKYIEYILIKEYTSPYFFINVPKGTMILWNTFYESFAILYLGEFYSLHSLTKDLYEPYNINKRIILTERIK